MIELPRPQPGRVVLEGQYTRLEPLTMAHAEQLYEASEGPANRVRFDYLYENPPDSLAETESWVRQASDSPDPLYFAVIDRASGRCEGRQALMRITPAYGVIELGSIYWGPAIARTRVATEALYLHVRYAFDALGYRRFEWKCNNLNEPSQRAARRFGFTWEGLFRQHMVVKGKNRDTAWYSIIDGEWPALRAAYESWLAPKNFDAAGQQLKSLQTFIAGGRTA